MFSKQFPNGPAEENPDPTIAELSRALFTLASEGSVTVREVREKLLDRDLSPVGWMAAQAASLAAERLVSGPAPISTAGAIRLCALASALPPHFGTTATRLFEHAARVGENTSDNLLQARYYRPELCSVSRAVLQCVAHTWLALNHLLKRLKQRYR